MTDQLPAREKQVWRSSDVETYRGFEYYRDGICQSFMDLIPEPDGGEEWDFSGSVETMPVGSGRLNRVVATSHLVLRTKEEISRSPAECFYLNYKTRGECRIQQSGHEAVIQPGDVGLFDSTVPFALEHRRRPDLAVSSFMLPHDALRERLGGKLPDQPMVISQHPNLGHLIRETAATLARDVEQLHGQKATRLYDMMLDLVAMALSWDGKARIDLPTSRANALLLAAKNYIDQHHAKAGLSVRDAAGALGISVRYLHKLFSRTEFTFGEYLLARRLRTTASALRSPGMSHLPVATIAFQSGFSDPAHFHRAFKARYGSPPGEWRRSQFTTTP